MHYTPLSGYSLPERNPSNPPVRAPLMSAFTTISPVTGELMVPGNSGVVIQADSGKEAIRVGGTAMTSNMTLPGFDTSLNQIQFYSNGNMVSAFDQNGLYFPNSKSVFIGNQTSFGQLTYTTGLTLNSNNNSLGQIILQISGVTYGTIQYANSLFKTQITSEGGLSLDTKSNGSVNVAAHGTGRVNFITGTITRAYVDNTGLNLNNIQSETGQMSLNTTSTTGQTLLGNQSTQGIGFNNAFGYGISFITSGNTIMTVGTYSVQVIHKPGEFGDFITFFNGGSAIGSVNQPNASSIQINYTSDYRLKQNIMPIQDSLELLNKLKPCSFEWKADGAHDIGFIAHEFAEVFPQNVTGVKDAVDENGKIISQQISYNICIPLLVDCVKTQQNEITNLKVQLVSLKANQEQHAEINELKEQLTSLKAMMDALVVSK